MASQKSNFVGFVYLTVHKLCNMITAFPTKFLHRSFGSKKPQDLSIKFTIYVLHDELKTYIIMINNVIPIYFFGIYAENKKYF